MTRRLLVFLLSFAFAPIAICENVTSVSEVTISIISPRDSSLWVGTKSHGLMRVGATGRPFSYSTLTGHLRCDCIKNLCFDENSVLWILDGEDTVLSYSSIDGFVRHASDAIPPAVNTVLLSPAPATQDIPPVADPAIALEDVSEANLTTPWYGRWWAFALILVLLVFAAYFSFIHRSHAPVPATTRSHVPETSPLHPFISSPSPAAAVPVVKPETAPRIKSESAPKAAPAERFSGVEDAFSAKVSSIIEEHFRNPDFGVEAIAEELGLSRVHLSRKLKASGAPSPSDLIKKRRMDEAASLIRSGETNIARVATLSGFSSSAYFSAAFKQFYGQTPSAFI